LGLQERRYLDRNWPREACF